MFISLTRVGTEKIHVINTDQIVEFYPNGTGGSYVERVSKEILDVKEDVDLITRKLREAYIFVEKNM